MRIEEEIKQEIFESEYHKLGINILYTGSWINHRNIKYFKKFGISPQQYNVLRILKGQYPRPSTINLVCERMIDKTSNASRLVEKLRLKGLVERKQCEHNRRAVDIIITAKGLDLLRKISSDFSFGRDFTSLSGEEAAALNSLLDKLRSSIGNEE